MSLRLLVCLMASLASPAIAEELTPIIVRGIVPMDHARVAGSVHVIGAKTFAAVQPITLKDALRALPGIHLIDEDALGLKLNIAVRGLNARRSGRSLLLEDGAPIQPAPYADPSAHHHPPLERIERIEFRKGSGQVLFGPQSIGGMINFVSRAVPIAPRLDAQLSVGERGFVAAHVGAGLGDAERGFMIDLTGKRSDGTRVAHESRVGEIAGKARTTLGPDHALTLHAAHYVERTQLTESGLTQARYAADPYANPFRHDVFELDRTSAQIVHDWQLGVGAAVSTQAYWADTYRASYRQTDSSTDAMTANPTTGCIGAVRTDYEEFAERCGNKMRPRRFRFWGIEPRFDLDYRLFGRSAALTLGARLHVEHTNRRRYNGLTAAARERDAGTLLRDDNDIATTALSGYLQNVVTLGDLGVTGGARIERIATRNRARVANFGPVDVTARATQTLVLPGAGLTWQRGEALTVFAGIHRGFAPPRPDRDYNPTGAFNAVRPERSTEVEVGFRARPHPGITVDATLFRMSLTDLIVEAALVGGRSGSFVNAGSARHSGVEVNAGVAIESLRARLAYSWLAEAKFTSDVEDTSRGVRGNRVPYAPAHMLNVAIGGVLGPISGEVGVNHVSRQFGNADNRTTPSADGTGGTIPARTLARLAFGYRPERASWRVFATVENLFDTRYASSRIDGLFAGARRQAIIGIATQLP